MKKNTNSILEILEERIDLLNRVIARCHKYLSRAVTGNLKIIRSNKIPQYYIKPEGASHYKFRSSTPTPDIKRIAQRDYARKICRSATSERDFLQSVINHYPKNTVEEVTATLSPRRRELITPIVLSDEEFAIWWKSQPYEKSTRDFTKAYRTDKGEFVRSKSELIIANTLYRLGIPYRYECRKILDDGSEAFPDFTILHPRTREIFYWEHFGRMDDPDYLSGFIWKMNHYALTKDMSAGHLITTFESLEQPLDPVVVKATITQYFL